MKALNEFIVVVLDDNAFYNRILTKRIKSYTEMLGFAFEKEYIFDIRSYTSAKECIENLDPETDIVFLDYFLDHKINATDLLESIRSKCNNCKLVVISQTETIGPMLQEFSEKPLEFIHKNEEALSKSCMLLDDIVSGRG